MNFKYIDIHSQLQFPQFDDDRDAIIEQMREEGVATITVGTDAKMSKEAVELAAQHPHLFATVGIHPTHIVESDGKWESFDETYYESLLSPKVVAIGECGLDYFRAPMDANEAQIIANKQKELFVRQIEFAIKHNLPLMIHARPSRGTMDAYDDVAEILEARSQQLEARGNMHFFVGDVPTAKRFLDLGFTLSFDGPVTFTSEYDETIRSIPSDMIMAETDAPFAAPVPHRGKRNSPLYVPFISDRLADIRGEDRDAFRLQTIENAKRVFRL